MILQGIHGYLEKTYLILSDRYPLHKQGSDRDKHIVINVKMSMGPN
jgi:hypothetical protein